MLASFFSVTSAISMAGSIRTTFFHSPIILASNLSVEVVSDSTCYFC